jgi:hypothetical protein|eukprot:6732839-Prymnesium_polylepis.1
MLDPPAALGREQPTTRPADSPPPSESRENFVLVPWLMRALQRAASMEEEGAEVSRQLRAMAAEAGRASRP